MMGTTMKAVIKNWDNAEIGSIELLEAVFGVEVRRDILTRTINWQLAKRRSGNHTTKGVSQISGTTKKPWAQKGTGRARQGSLRSPQFRKGGIIFGPVVRSHAHDLPKKVRQLALRMALASKQKDGNLIVIESGALADHKTKNFTQKLKSLGVTSALIIDGANLNENCAKATRNLPKVNLLSEQGANVYDILRHETLVLTKNAVEQLQERLK